MVMTERVPFIRRGVQVVAAALLAGAVLLVLVLGAQGARPGATTSGPAGGAASVDRPAAAIDAWFNDASAARGPASRVDDWFNDSSAGGRSVAPFDDWFNDR
jgi:hypothetical protein